MSLQQSDEFQPGFSVCVGRQEIFEFKCDLLSECELYMSKDYYGYHGNLLL